jgi:hypothetical protein
LEKVSCSRCQQTSIDKNFLANTLKTVCLPIPNKDDVESHLVMACAAGKMLHKTGLKMLQIECTRIKTPILGVCDRTRFLVLLIIVKKICRDEVSDCQELYCTHEEADTRMIVHAIHADKTFGESGIKGRIIVKSPERYRTSPDDISRDDKR